MEISSTRERWEWAARHVFSSLLSVRADPKKCERHPKLMGLVTHLHTAPRLPWPLPEGDGGERKNQIPGPFNKNKMAILKQVLLLPSANGSPHWVMSPLCRTTTSYQVSHKGSFIKLDSPLVFIALIKGHKRPFFSAFWCWIINSINWTQLSS